MFASNHVGRGRYLANIELDAATATVLRVLAARAGGKIEDLPKDKDGKPRFVDKLRFEITQEIVQMFAGAYRAAWLADGRLRLLAGEGAPPRVFAVWHREARRTDAAWRFELVGPSGDLGMLPAGNLVSASAINAINQEGPRKTFVI